MSAFPECDKSLARTQQWARDNGYPVWGYCTTLHCDDNVSYNHQFCYCQGLFQPPPGQQCQNGVGSLIPLTDKSCYCCCSCFAWDTPISISKDMVKAVQDFVINDPVWIAKDSSLTSWVQMPVKFSSGTGAVGQNKLIKLHFGDQTKGITLKPDSFESRFVSKEESQNFFKILSTAPNNYIDANGLVNLTLVKKANPDTIATLLATTYVVAKRIYDILKIDSNYLLVTGLQPFLMKNGSLKQAEKLVPGSDELVREDGTTTPIISLEVGMFDKGVHHIATSNQPATSLDGHLMVANGIVVGDYSTQLSLAGGGGLSNEHSAAPVFGTKAYADKHVHLKATPFSAHAHTPVLHQVDSFKPYHHSKALEIPAGAFKFVSSLQAEELLHNAPIFPASNNLAEPDVRYLFKMFGAFFPDITFYYDANNMMPNAYAFRQYGRTFVVVNCGWTLIEGIYIQGIAMTIAHLVAELNRENSVPTDVNPIGLADFNVYPIFLSIYYNAQQAAMMYNAALNQMKKVFSFIKKHRKTKNISLDCRLKAFENSIGGLPLPNCAGGPPDPALELVKITAEKPAGAAHAIVSITFNLQVDPASAAAIGNYFFDPMATVFAASVDSKDSKKVNLEVDIKPKTEYYGVVTGVLSIRKQPMVTGKNGAKFTLK